MAYERIDGMVIVAKLKRSLLGGAVYQDVEIRREDGDVRRLGTIMVLSDMTHALVPGSRGRFYTYNVLGSKGVYGFRPIGRAAHARFPHRWEIMMLAMGGLNLLVALAWLLLNGSIALLATGMGLIGLIFGAIFVATRIGAMRAFAEDDPAVRANVAMRSLEAGA